MTSPIGGSERTFAYEGWTFTYKDPRPSLEETIRDKLRRHGITNETLVQEIVESAIAHEKNRKALQ